MNLNSSLKKLGPWAVLEYIINPIISLATTPIIINKLGVSAFGNWTLIIASTSLAVTLGSGISLALSRHVSNNYQKDPKETKKAQLDAVHLTIILSTAAAALILILLKSRNADLILLTLATLIVMVESFDAVFASILRGRLLNKLLTQTEASSRVVQFICMVLLLNYYNTIDGVILGYLFGSMTRLFLRYRLNEIYIYDIIQHRLRKNSLILPSMGWATILNLGGAMYNSLDKMIISHIFGASTLAIYSVATQLTNQIQAVFSAALSVQINVVAKNVASDGSHELYLQFLNITKYVFILSTIIYFAFYLTSGQIYKEWVSEDVAKNVMPFIFPAILISFSQTISIPAHFLTIGMGHIKFAALISAIASGAALIFLLIGSIFFDAELAILAKCIYGTFLFIIFTWNIIKNDGSCCEKNSRGRISTGC